MRALKILLASVASLLALAIVAAIAFVHFVDPNAYKGLLTDRFTAHTGRALVIDGDLELAFLPRLALQGERVTLGHPPGFDFSEPFATVERISAGIELKPLLERRLEIGSIRIDGARVNLVRGNDGRGNWQDFRADTAAPGLAVEPDESSRALADRLDIERVEVRNAELRWHEAGRLRYVLSGIGLTTGRIRNGEPIPVWLSLTAEDTASARRFAVEAESAVGPAALGSAADDAFVTLRGFRLLLRAFDPSRRELASGELTADRVDAARDGRVGIGPARLDGRLSPVDAAPSGLDFGAAWRGLRFDPANGALAVEALETRVAGIAAEWRLDVRDAIDAPRIAGTFRVADAELGSALDVFRITPPGGIDLDALGGLDVTGTLRATLTLADADAAGASQAAIGPYRVDELDIDALSVEALGAVLRGAVELGNDGALRGTISTSPMPAERLHRLLGESMPAAISPAELGAVEFAARFEFDPNVDQLAIDDIALTAFGLAANGRARIDSLRGPIAATGEGRVAPFSPRELMQRFGQAVPDASDPTALQRAVVQARFEADGSGGRFSDIELMLDDSRITGDYAIDGLANPAHRFRLAIDDVNVDRYLPPRAAELANDAEDARTAGDMALPTDALAALRIDGEVSVDALRLAGLDFRDVATRIEVGGGRAALDPARATLYGGEFAGRFELDARAAPTLRLAGRAASIELAPIITALTGDANISGIGDFDLDLVGTGATLLDIVAAANGRVAFSMRDGAIEGFNLARALCVVYNTTQRLPAPAEQPSRTAYASIGGTASVQDGVASSRDLLARTGFMDLTGAGHLALAEQRLDYTLEAALTGAIDIAGCEAMDQLIGESLPLTLRGTVTDPTIRPDFSEIIQRRLRNVVRDRLQDRLRDLLR